MGASQSESGVVVEMEVEEWSPVIILQDTNYWEMKRDRYIPVLDSFICQLDIS